MCRLWSVLRRFTRAAGSARKAGEHQGALPAVTGTVFANTVPVNPPIVSSTNKPSANNLGVPQHHAVMARQAVMVRQCCAVVLYVVPCHVMLSWDVGLRHSSSCWQSSQPAVSSEFVCLYAAGFCCHISLLPASLSIRWLVLWWWAMNILTQPAGKPSWRVCWACCHSWCLCRTRRGLSRLCMHMTTLVVLKQTTVGAWVIRQLSKCSADECQECAVSQSVMPL